MLFALDILCLWAMVSLRKLLNPLKYISLSFLQTSILNLQTVKALPLFRKIHPQCIGFSLLFPWFFNYYCLAFTLLFCLHVFLRVLFHISVIMKLQIALYLDISMASCLTSHQIMWQELIGMSNNGHNI